LVQLFLQHTSASLTINENADPDVRADLNRWLDRAIPENAPYFEHTAEGPDDMPAHVKASVLGCSVMIPIRQGRLALGTWQGIYLASTARRRAAHRRRDDLGRVRSSFGNPGQPRPAGEERCRPGERGASQSERCHRPPASRGGWSQR